MLVTDEEILHEYQVYEAEINTVALQARHNFWLS